MQVSISRCLAVFVLAAGAALAAQAQGVPKGEQAFTEHVAALLRKEVGDVVSIKAPLTLELGELQANLHRIFDFCQRDADRCAAELDTYLQGAIQLHRDRSAPPSRDAIRLVVRSVDYLRGIADSLPPDAPALLPRPVADGLMVLPVLDSPRTISMLSETDRKKLGLTADEVHRLGRAQTEAVLEPLSASAKAVGRGQIGQLLGDVFESSRFAFHDSWAPLAALQGGQLVVAVPTTDALLYIGDDGPASLDALRAFVRQLMDQAPNRLSSNLYRWTPAGWELVR